MKIAIYCTNNIVYPVPAGTIYANMTVAGEMADKLTEMGEEVTFFAPEGTQTKAKLVSFDMKPFSDPQVYSLYPDPESSYKYENVMMLRMLNFLDKEQFDVLQTHCRPFSIADFAPLKPLLPVVATAHDPVSYPLYKLLPLYNQFINLHLVSISMAQRPGQTGIEWAANIYNGVDADKWEFKAGRGEYLVFAGRMMEEKGPDTAIQVALKTGMKLKLAGSMYDKDKEFFETKIKPFLGPQIEYLGAVPREQLNDLYGGAAALLMPIKWEEPFGLVMIEAMACGTPVIALKRGSVPEVVVDGRTGYIVDSSEEMEESVKNIGKIDRADCRKSVEEKFSLQKMAEEYLKLYKSLV